MSENLDYEFNEATPRLKSSQRPVRSRSRSRIYGGGETYTPAWLGPLVQSNWYLDRNPRVVSALQLAPSEITLGP